MLGLAFVGVFARMWFSAIDSEGPSFSGGFALQISTNGPGSWIVGPTGVAVPAVAPGRTQRDGEIIALAGVGGFAFAGAGGFLVGEAGERLTGRSLGFFIIDTSTGFVQQGLTGEQLRSAWTALGRGPLPRFKARSEWY